MLVVKNYSPDGRAHVVMFPGTFSNGDPVAIAVEFNKTKKRVQVNDISTIHGAGFGYRLSEIKRTLPPVEADYL